MSLDCLWSFYDIPERPTNQNQPTAKIWYFERDEVLTPIPSRIITFLLKVYPLKSRDITTIIFGHFVLIP